MNPMLSRIIVAVLPLAASCVHAADTSANRVAAVTIVVWAIRESGNHALAGIWHEGTDLKQKETSSVRKVQRGQRQYALFAGLNKEGSACDLHLNGRQSV